MRCLTLATWLVVQLSGAAPQHVESTQSCVEGRRSFDEHDYELAAERFSKCRLVSDSSEVLAYIELMLGLSLQNGGDKEQGLIHLLEAYRLRPNYVDASYSLASHYSSAHQYADAALFAMRAFESSNELDAELKIKAGLFSILAGDNSLGLSLLQDAPANPETGFLRALAYLRLGDKTSALTSLAVDLGLPGQRTVDVVLPGYVKWLVSQECSAGGPAQREADEALFRAWREERGAPDIVDVWEAVAAMKRGDLERAKDLCGRVIERSKGSSCAARYYLLLMGGERDASETDRACKAESKEYELFPALTPITFLPVELTITEHLKVLRGAR